MATFRYVRNFRPYGVRLALLATLLAGGCAPSGVLSPTTAFTSDHDDAIVLAGVWLRRETCPETVFFVPQWRQLDPATHRFLDVRIGGEIHCNRVYPENHIYPRLEKAVPQQWIMKRVPPGHYALESVYVNQLNYFWRTYFVETGDDGRLTNANAVSGFEAGPGKVTYIGNVEFDIGDAYFKGQKDNVRIVRGFRDEDAARAFLAGYPNITAPLVSVTPQPMAVPAPD